MIQTPEEFTKTIYLKNEFKIKDPEKKNLCQLVDQAFADGILIYQATYTKKVLNCLHIEKAHLLSTTMVVQSLNMKKKEHFHPKEDHEEILDPKGPYLSTIDTLMYLANYT